MQEKALAPWEVPPDESYWQALLQEQNADETEVIVSLEKTVPPSLQTPERTESAATDVPAVDRDALVASGDSPAAGLENHSAPIDKAPAHVASAIILDAADLAPELETEPIEPDPSSSAPPAPDLVSEPLDDAAFYKEGQPLSPEDAASWERFRHYRDADTAVELTVESYNRGGLLVRWEQVVGFVPASQLCDGLRYSDEQARLRDLATRVGSSLTLKVIEVDSAKNRLILSERAARHVDDPDLDVLDELNPGDVCHGQVTNLCTFGAFIDLGGVEGLIHISELSWGRVSHPADILQSGQQVQVFVLNVDRSQGRVGLSLKRLQPDPWTSVEERYQVGQVIEGEITNIVNFGAFVRLEEGLEGLIHTSELNGAAASGLYTLREGTRVLVRINSIEGERHRIGLSLE